MDDIKLARIAAARDEIPPLARDRFSKHVADLLRPLREPRDLDVDLAIEEAMRRVSERVICGTCEPSARRKRAISAV